MYNVEIDKLNLLKDQSKNLYNSIDEADNWVSKNLKFEEKDKVSYSIKHSRRLVRKIHKSIQSKPVFALFGASQVGKSYLIKNLLSIEGAPLEIKLGDNSYDFLKEINPPGVGAESTGVVTRFSIDHPLNNHNFPIKIKLLDVKDIILILCDSFFTDIKKLGDNVIISETIKDYIENLDAKFKAHAICQNTLIEDDILDIQDYFTRNFYRYSHIVDSINNSNYWLKLGTIISKIPSKEWVNAFSILWNKNEHISLLFQKLVNELSLINFASIVYAPQECVLRGHGEILDVQRLKEMNSNQKRITIVNSNEEQFELNLCYLSALSAELTLSVSKKVAECKKFLYNTDLLDFPGARSRLGLSLDTISNESIPDMYLRGKIAYLFNKYSSDYEINNLIFCQNDKQLDVNEIPFLLNDWIHNNIGKNAEAREQSINELPVSPLFVVFTFFNNQLKFDTTNDDKDDISYKWNTRFNRFFEQEVVTSNHNWHTHWTLKNPIFKNFYLLRDYKYSNDTFYGFEDKNHEIDINPERVNFMEKLKLSFLSHPFVSKHFENPFESWSNAAAPNMDGSSLIIKNLNPAANNYIKTYNYVTQLNDILQKLKIILSKYLHSDNLFEKRLSSIKKGNELQIELNRVFGRNPLLFGEFLKLMLLSESDVYNYFHENLLSSRQVESFDEYTLFRSQFPQLKAENSKDQNLEILQKTLFYSNIEEVELFLSQQNIDLEKVFANNLKTSATALVDGLIRQWQSKLNIDNFENLITYGLSKNAFNEIINVVNASFENLNIKDVLVNLVEKKTSRIQISRNDEEFLAGVCTNFLNEFVTSFGINFMGNERIDELRLVCDELNFDFYEIISTKPLPNKNELIPFFDNQEISASAGNDLVLNPMIENYNKYITKLKLSLLSNCGFVTYDVQANNALSGILNNVNALRFEIK